MVQLSPGTGISRPAAAVSSLALQPTCLASYPVRTLGFFPGEKLHGREAAHSFLSSFEAKNAWSYTSVPPTSSLYNV